MGETRVEDEGFGFAKGVYDAVQEPYEERCLEAHGTRCIEQEYKPQRFDLASAPGEIQQRATM